MEKKYKVVYIAASIGLPIQEEYFEDREKCVKFILEHKYDIISVYFGEHKPSLGGLLCWMGDLIDYKKD